MAKWTNWSGRQTATPMRVVRPRSEADYIAAVDMARTRQWPIRAIGSSHSHSRVAAVDGLLVETDGWQGPPRPSDRPSAGAGEPVVTVRSGTKIFQLGEPLYRLGYALINQGDIDKQSIVGALSTGTHGTGPTLGNFSTAVRGIRLVLADGQVVECSQEHQPDLFSVARHSLGAVGLITEVDLAVRHRYRLHERQWVAGFEEVMPRIDELVAATRHFEFFWVPNRDLFACKTLDEVETDGTETDDTESTEAPADDTESTEAPAESPEPEVVNDRERRGWSHRIISSIRDDKHTEMEYAVPAASGPACFAELRDMIGVRFPELEWPLEYRTLAADDLPISVAGGRQTVTISAHQDVSLDDRPLFSACEEIFRRYEGRPHWGKVHYQTGEELARLYPDYHRWWEIRDQFDPDGRFVTPDLERLRP